MTGPRVFGLPHLSEDSVAAFADGVLSAAAAARARRHCAECAECSAAVRGQREAAMMLRTARTPTLPAGLLDRLAGLPMSAPLPPPRSGLPTALGADGVPVFIAHSRVCQPPVPSPSSQPELSSQPEPEPPVAMTGHPIPDRSGPARSAAHAGHRRGVLSASILASAAAVVAAGTIGGSTSSFQPTLQQPAAVNFASNLVGSSSGGGVSGSGSTSDSGSTSGLATTPGRQHAAENGAGTSRFDSGAALLIQQAAFTVDRRHPAP